MRKVEKLTKELNKLRGQRIDANDEERAAIDLKIRSLRMDIALASPTSSSRRYR